MYNEETIIKVNMWPSVLCDYGFSVSVLWCPLRTPTILFGFLLPWAWGISSRLLLTLDEGYLLTAAIPDLQRGIAPLGLPAPEQPLLLGRGVNCQPEIAKRSNCQHPLDHGKSKRVPEKHLFLLY